MLHHVVLLLLYGRFYCWETSACHSRAWPGLELIAASPGKPALARACTLSRPRAGAAATGGLGVAVLCRAATATTTATPPPRTTTALLRTATDVAEEATATAMGTAAGTAVATKAQKVCVFVGFV